MPVDLAPDLKRNKKLYTGYFNYRILSDTLRSLKTLYFKGYPLSMVKAYRKQFQNPKLYHYHGDKVVRDYSEEKWV